MKLCLNQASRPERWSQAQTEFARVGLTDVERFLSINADQPNKSFCLSQYALLKQFLGSGKDALIAFEDDVIFRDLSHLQAALDELPADWDLLYLGANITDMVFGIKEFPPTRFSTYLYRVRRAWTSHAIVYTRRIAEVIVKDYPVHTFEMFDNWLSQNILPKYNCFLINPMACWQRKGYSDLWSSETNYTGAFEWGNKFMSK